MGNSVKDFSFYIPESVRFSSKYLIAWCFIIQ